MCKRHIKIDLINKNDSWHWALHLLLYLPGLNINAGKFGNLLILRSWWAGFCILVGNLALGYNLSTLATACVAVLERYLTEIIQSRCHLSIWYLTSQFTRRMLLTDESFYIRFDSKDWLLKWGVSAILWTETVIKNDSEMKTSDGHYVTFWIRVWGISVHAK